MLEAEHRAQAAGGSGCFPRCGPGSLQVCSNHREAATGKGREISSTQLTEGVSGVALAWGWHIRAKLAELPLLPVKPPFRDFLLLSGRDPGY